ncbi:MAG: DUF4982 domain-containing protein [Spirochaetaceae bacterium]|jgi:beta-galactosidase|nr:DUF4982 domain-containing protein [Spirochaetaceae bacterium]
MQKTLFNEGWSVRPKTTVMAGFGGELPRGEAVTLPHDIMIGQKRSAENSRDKGYFPNGSYEYVKTFMLEDVVSTSSTTVDLPVVEPVETTIPAKMVFEFEGVYRNARVFINDEYAGQHPYGYSNFYIEATNFLQPGENSIRVTCDATDDSRWYSGQGIYRNVWLWTGSDIRFAINGVKVTTESINDDGSAVITIENIIESDSPKKQTAYIISKIDNKEERTAATLYQGQTIVRQRIVMENAKLWDCENPYLYTLNSVIESSRGSRGSRLINFGIRTLQVDAKHGLRLNGHTVKLRGACIHHDNGIIGSVTFEAAEYRRATKLKEAGFNAIRSTHHPMSKAMLNVCDRLGILVMDEAFDMWTLNKTQDDYAQYFPEWWERDIRAMVEKDYNHPCVVMYSIGNEIPDTGLPNSIQWGRKLAEKIRGLDSTRFVCNSVNLMFSAMGVLMKHRAEIEKQISAQAAEKSAHNKDANINTAMADSGERMKAFVNSDIVSKITEESFACVDIAGFNYADNRYIDDGTRYPNRVIVGSETFTRDIATNWELVKKLPYVIGDFTWTGWDYLGEAGIGKITYGDMQGSDINGGYPWLAAWCGDIDICGNRRPQSFWREIVWDLRKEPYIAVLDPKHYGEAAVKSPWSWSDSISSWTWPGFEEKPVQIEVYSDADEVALLLNGKEINRKPLPKTGNRAFIADFDTMYSPGKLEAVAYTDGKETGRYALQTAGEVSFIMLHQEDVISTGSTIIYVAISLVDKDGIVNTASDKEIRLSIDGPALLQGFGSARPITEESFTDSIHTTFNGRALAVLRRTGEGSITIKASCTGLAEGEISIL